MALEQERLNTHMNPLKKCVGDGGEIINHTNAFGLSKTNREIYRDENLEKLL